MNKYRYWHKIFKNEIYPNLNPDVSRNKKTIVETSNGAKERIYNLWQRGEGFKLIFETLLNKKDGNFKIIETGTLRTLGAWSDGQSADVFSKFVSIFGGFVYSVDINKKSVEMANTVMNNEYFKSHHSDSVQWLQGFDNKHEVDLFYLDSYDCKWFQDTKSAEHHLKEFMVIEPYLNNTIVAIDDNIKLSSGIRSGKGRLIYEHLESKNHLPVYDDYQLIYKF